MSYKKGDLRLTVAQCGHEGCAGDPECWVSGGRFWVRDAREDLRSAVDSQKRGAYLPHSCDEWYIGGKNEVAALIEDLKAALEAM